MILWTWPLRVGVWRVRLSNPLFRTDADTLAALGLAFGSAVPFSVH
jgi:hypothetical protein